MEPRLKTEYGPSATQRIMKVSADEDVTYNKWTLLGAVFLKYGIAPLVCLLFAYWLQEKDRQITDLNARQMMMIEHVTSVIDSNTRALDNLTREMKETHR